MKPLQIQKLYSHIPKYRRFILFILSTIIFNTVSAQQAYYSVNSASNPLQAYSIPTNRESHPFFIDIDGDNDLDCFSGEYVNERIAKIYFYKNEGTEKYPVFKSVAGDKNPLSNIESNRLSVPYFIDIDNDGDYDCFIGEGSTGAILYLKNTGSAKQPDFVKQSAAFNPLSMVKLSTSEVASPAFADLDGDGDYDCVVVDEAGEVNYFKNTGTRTKPAFEHITEGDNPFLFLAETNGVYNLSFSDWNGDGLIDMFINTTYYKNTGTKQHPQFSSNFSKEAIFEKPLSSKYTYTPLRWTDLNSDGIKEAVQGDTKGGFVYRTYVLKNAQTASNTVFVQVSPNPSSSEFTIKVSPANTSLFRITDSQGKLLTTKISSNSTLTFGRELTAGVYFLQIMQNNKVIFTTKLVKE